MEENSESISISATFNTICRLCLKQGKFKSLHNLTNSFNILEALLGYELPNQICQVCYEELERITVFLKQCKQSYNILKQIEEECEKLQKPNNDVKIEILNLQEKIMDKSEKEIEIPVKKVKLNVNRLNKLKVCPKDGLVVITRKDHYKKKNPCIPQNIKSSSTTHHIDRKLLYICHICLKMFKHKETLSNHIQEHCETSFICEVCGEEYATEALLDKHRESHQQLLYSCVICSETFTSHALYTKHERHHNVTKAICDVCNKEFIHARALKLHQISHEKNKIFKCNWCEKEFLSKALLNRHSPKHDSEKPFVCMYCPKSFNSRGCLNAHTRVHTGERPFQCKVCSKTFTQQTHLTYHMLLHTGEKSFACTECNKTFRLKGNLTVHMRGHTGELPYICHVCKKGFRDASQRKKHVICKHGVEEVEFIRKSDSNEL